MFETEMYERIPFPVQRVEVTEKNIEELARWTGGEIQVVPSPNKTRRKFIRIDAIQNPQNDEQKRAYIGNILLYAERGGFKVYSKKAFERSFRKVEGALPKQVVLVEQTTAADVKKALESPVFKNNHSHELNEPCVDDCPVNLARSAAEQQFEAGKDETDILAGEEVIVDKHTAEAHEGLAAVPADILKKSAEPMVDDYTGVATETIRGD